MIRKQIRTCLHLTIVTVSVGGFRPFHGFLGCGDDDSRQPITLPILRNLIEITPSLCSAAYNTFFEGRVYNCPFFLFAGGRHCLLSPLCNSVRASMDAGRAMIHMAASLTSVHFTSRGFINISYYCD